MSLVIPAVWVKAELSKLRNCLENTKGLMLIYFFVTSEGKLEYRRVSRDFPGSDLIPAISTVISDLNSELQQLMEQLRREKEE